MTSAKFSELKEYIESCRKKREVINNQITQSKSTIFHEENKLEKLKKNLSEAYAKEKKVIIKRISEVESDLTELNTQLHKKQTSVFSKLFGKQQTIDVIKEDIKEKEKVLRDLNNTINENAKFENLELIPKEQFEKNEFLKQFLTTKKELDIVTSLVGEKREELKILLDQHAHCKARIDDYIETDSSQEYKAVASTFGNLITSNKKWGISSEIDNADAKASAKSFVTRKEVSIILKDVDFIESAEPGLYFESISGNNFFIYSTLIISTNQYGIFKFSDITELNISFKQKRFIETNDTVPSDSKIVDYLWQKINKDGTPDLRFKGNYKSPVVSYGVIEFTIDSILNETYYISHLDFAQSFANELMSYTASLRPIDGNTDQNLITKQYFEIVKEFGDHFVAFTFKLQDDKAFRQTVLDSPFFKSQSFETVSDLLKFYITKDLISCFNITGDLSKLRSKEAFALLYIMSKRNSLDIDTYSKLSLLYSEGLMLSYKNMFEIFKPNLSTLNDTNMDFVISILLSIYNTDLQKEYLSNLYRFASIVVKADGTVTQDEEKALKKILSLSEQHKTFPPSNEEKSHNAKSENVKVFIAQPEQTINDSLNELNSLIGLDAVKQEVSTLVNFVRIQKARESSGLKSSSLSYHIVFTGNPGTGKTTVARLVAEIYKNLGVIKKGHLVETDRSGLIAEYLGQTAVKVNRIVDSALDGILFIDEAYSLVGENRDDFGKEAVATLIKRMEDNRSNLIVILAGYSNEMKSFINVNPGLKSRFNRYIEFVDYTEEELLDIYKLSCNKLDYALTNEAEQKLQNLFKQSLEFKDKSFGNGRFVRNIFEKTLERQANRIAGVNTLDRETLTTISINDIPNQVSV